MDINEFSPVQIAILALLKARDITGKYNMPIPGKTHLVKELFTIKMTPLGGSLLKDLSFEADNFGPFDETVYAALDDLNYAGFVGLEQSGNYVKIKITAKGQEEIDKIWNKFRDEIISLFTYVKVNYNHLSSTELLDKIYSVYPAMTKYSISKVAEKYR